MAKERKMRSSDFFGDQRTRDASAARRHVEELGQNDQIIALLTEQNELLRYIANRMHEQAREYTP